MKLTPFGIALRKLRLDKGLRLMDVSDKLGVTAAFLSSVETGRKPIPDGFVLRLSRALDLNSAEIRDLGRAVDRTRKEVRVTELAEDQRELVAAFARKLDELPADVVAKLKNLVLKAIAEEVPFQRQRRGISVPALSTSAIRRFAEQVRSAFVEDDRIDFPIMNVLEFRLHELFDGFALAIGDASELGDEEGRVIPGANCIILREDVYHGAWNDEPRHRFTACHELGHFLMHRRIAFARLRSDSERIYCDAEWQADTFAGTLLVSSRHLGKFSGPQDVVSKCKVSHSAAEVMLRKYETTGSI